RDRNSWFDGECQHDVAERGGAVRGDWDSLRAGSDGASGVDDSGWSDGEVQLGEKSDRRVQLSGWSSGGWDEDVTDHVYGQHGESDGWVLAEHLSGTEPRRGCSDLLRDGCVRWCGWVSGRDLRQYLLAFAFEPDGSE